MSYFPKPSIKKSLNNALLFEKSNWSQKNFFHTYAQASYEATYYLQEIAGL